MENEGLTELLGDIHRWQVVTLEHILTKVTSQMHNIQKNH